MTGETLARLCAGAALDKKAADPVVLDLRGLTSIADWFVIVSATSDRHLQTVAENVVEAVEKMGRRPMGKEGLGGGRWALVDLGEVVVHVFHQQAREYYDLERIWTDAPHLDLD